MYTIADDCAQIAESSLKPPFQSPHLDFPENFARKDTSLPIINKYGPVGCPLMVPPRGFLFLLFFWSVVS